MIKKPLELSNQLAKVKIDHKNIKIDMDIFNGMDDYNNINTKFDNFTQKFSNEISKNQNIIIKDAYNKYRSPPKIQSKDLNDNQKLNQNQTNPPVSKNLRKSKTALSFRKTKNVLISSQKLQHFSKIKQINNQEVEYVQDNQTANTNENFRSIQSASASEIEDGKNVIVDKFSLLIDEICHNFDQFNPIMLEKICSPFGIKVAQLRDITDLDSRQNHMIQCMSLSIQQNLYQLEQQIQKNINKYQKQDQQRQQKFEDLGEKKYEWLQIHSKQDQLLIKLQKQIIEDLDDENNINQVQPFIQQYKNQNQEKIKKFHKFKTNLDIEENGKQVQQKIEKIQWDQQKENDFLQTRKEKEKQLFSLAKYSNFFGISMYNILNKLHLEEPLDLYKNQLISDYYNREGLTENELRFLVRHSDLLYRHIDKSYIQMIISLIDPQVIDNLEWQIAEQTIQKYSQSLEIAKQKRYNYIKSFRNDLYNKEQEDNQKIAELNKKKLEGVQRSKQLQIIKKKFMNQLLMIEYRNRNKIKNPYVIRFCYKLMERCYIKSQAFYIKDKTTTKFQQRNYPAKEKSILFVVNDEPLNVEKVKRLFHPSSKVIMNLEQLHEPKTPVVFEQFEFNKQPEAEIYVQKYDKNLLKNERKQMIAYKLKTKQIDQADNQSKFVEFYSAGPMNLRKYQSTKFINHKYEDYNDNYHKQNQWITSEIENAAARKLQHFFRASLKRIAFKAAQRTCKQQRAIKIDNKVRQIIHDKQEKLLKETLMMNKMNKTKLPSPKDQTSSSFTNTHYFTRQETNYTNPDLKKLRMNTEQQYNKMGMDTEQTIVSPKMKTMSKIDEQEVKLQLQKVMAYGKVQTKRKKSFETIKNQKYKNPNEIKFVKPKKIKLDLKHKKLLICSKQKLFVNAKASGYNFVPDIDVNILDDKGKSPLWYCTKNEDRPFIQWLLEKKASVNLLCSGDNTVLHYAFEQNLEELIILYLDHGGDLNIINSDGFTPVAKGQAWLIKSLGLTEAITRSSYKDSSAVSTQDNNQFWEIDRIYQKNEFIGDEYELIDNPIYYQYQSLHDPLQSIHSINQVSKLPMIATYLSPEERKKEEENNQKLKHFKLNPFVKKDDKK